MDAPTLWPAPDVLAVDHVVADDQSLTLIVHTYQPTASCPTCGHSSGRVHSHYQRALADLPWHGVAVHLQLQTRRFFCTNVMCHQCIFTERLPDFVQPYARKTVQLQHLTHLIGLALGGRAGAQLAQDIGLDLQRDTLLRLVKKQSCFMAETPRVLGVDDFAFRRGHHYGTILIDLEKHRVVDLLRDREAQTFAAWLKAHPGVEIISRDRGPAYAEGARQGAPDALQVADRWHLLKNLADTLEKLLLQEHRAVLQAVQFEAQCIVTMAQETSNSSSAPGSPTNTTVLKRQLRLVEEKQQRRERRLARYEEVIHLYRQGYSIRAIEQLTGRSRKTVRRYILAPEFPERAARPARPTKLHDYIAYLQGRWEEGCHNAQRLCEEIQELGYTGKFTLVRDYLQNLRRGLPHRSHNSRDLFSQKHANQAPYGDSHNGEKTAVEEAIPPPLPTVHSVLWWLLRPDEQLEDVAHQVVERLCELSAPLRRARELALWFFRMVRERRAEEFGAWIEAAKETGVPCLRGFAQKLLTDRAAVIAGLSEPWSNGQTEGQVNRLKLLKRQMYGRAGFDLLKARVLASR